jgi:hypothetical protein
VQSHSEAIGGQLEVVDRVSDGAVKIRNFVDLGQLALV